MAEDIPSLSDEEIIARERRKTRGATLFGLAVSLPFVAVLFLLAWARDNGFHTSAASIAIDWLMRGFPLLLLVSGWLVYRRFRPAKEALTDRIRRKRVDEFQKKFRFGLMIFILVAGFECFDFARQPAFAVRHPYSQLLFLFFLMMAAAVIALGQGWPSRRFLPSRDDELAQALRARVASIGYLVLMLALGAVYSTELYRPALISIVVRGALFAGIAIPALSYLFLEWRAGRGG